MESGWAQASKVIAAVLGSFIASLGIHLSFASYFGQKQVVATSLFSIYILWAFLVIVVYWVKKPWIAWAILLPIILLSILAIYFKLS